MFTTMDVKNLEHIKKFDEKKRFEEHLKAEKVEKSLKYSDGMWNAYVVGPLKKKLGYY